MGNGFELKIGMSTQQVISNISSMKANDKTKQFIINFCNSDEDKKVTNEVELAMLDSWASGLEKVKMPTKGKGVKPLHVEVFSDGTNVSYWESGSNKSVIKDLDGNYDRLVLDGHSANWSNNTTSDELTDLDDDGYADVRKYKPDIFKINLFKEDKNLDGNWDNSSRKSQKGNFKVTNVISY